MTKANIRPILDANLYPDGVHADKWTIIFFDKNGNSYTCPKDIFPSEEAAQEKIKLAMTWIGVESRVDNVVNWRIMRPQLSHAVPMPVKE